MNITESGETMRAGDVKVGDEILCGGFWFTVYSVRRDAVNSCATPMPAQENRRAQEKGTEIVHDNGSCTFDRRATRYASHSRREWQTEGNTNRRLLGRDGGRA